MAFGKKRRGPAGTETEDNPKREFRSERTVKTSMAIRLDSGNGAATDVRETNRVKEIRDKRSRVPRWAVLLFVILAAFAVARTLQRGVEQSKATQPPVRPVLVAKV